MTYDDYDGPPPPVGSCAECGEPAWTWRNSVLLCPGHLVLCPGHLSACERCGAWLADCECQRCPCCEEKDCDCRPVLASSETGVRAPDGYRETVTDYYCEVHHRDFYQVAGSHP